MCSVREIFIDILSGQIIISIDISIRIESDRSVRTICVYMYIYSDMPYFDPPKNFNETSPHEK